MSIKEMPLEEKYDKLVDMFFMIYATSFTIIKQLGAEDKFLDLFVKSYKNMLPSYLGTAFKMLRTLSPGRAFKQVMDQMTYNEQMMIPLSCIEYTRGDRETTVRIENCPHLKRIENMMKKLDLDFGPREMCMFDLKVLPAMGKEFGVDLRMELLENGCAISAKL